jgi:hypothetical protein
MNDAAMHVGAEAFRTSRALLEAELGWLDEALRHLIRGLSLQRGEDGGHGWFISAQEAERLVAPQQQPDAGGAALEPLRARRRDILAGRTASADVGTPLAQLRLAQTFQLSPLEELILLACLAPELDGKYGRVYGYLHDDLTRRQPSLQLIASLARLDETLSDVERLLLDQDLAIFRWQLVSLQGDSLSQQRLPQGLSIDPRIAAFLLEVPQLDARVLPYLRPLPPLLDEEPEANGHNEILGQLERLLRERRQVLAFCHGRGAAEGRSLAQRVCRRLGATLLHADVEAMLLAGQSGGLPFGEGLRRVYREALLRGAGVYLSRFDRLLDEPRAPALLHELEALLHEAAWFTCAEGERLWLPPALTQGAALLPIALAAPDYRERQVRWRGALRAAGAALDDAALCALAARYRFTAGEIAQAARLAGDHARADGATRPDETAVRRACRHYAKARADRLARQTEPRALWDDLVVPVDVRAQLEELCAQVRHRGKVLYEWGFDRRLTLGKGLYALFTGPSGTGKTLAAEVIARALEFDLLKIDLSAVVSKYIGETEKNLQRVFDSADRADCILFFDEADALFGKRSEIKDAHDRYANIEINFLLQRLDEYEGVAILASNLAQNIDEAFSRRLQFTVEFPFPDEQLRLAIWRNHFPKEAPVAADLDLEYFAREFKISGGSIRKIVLNAAFLAADEGARITAGHLLRATRREYERMGKPYLVGQGPQLRPEVQA